MTKAVEKAAKLLYELGAITGDATPRVEVYLNGERVQLMAILGEDKRFQLFKAGTHDRVHGCNDLSLEDLRNRRIRTFREHIYEMWGNKKVG